MKLDNPVNSDSTPEQIVEAASEIASAYYDADLQMFYMACDAMFEKAKAGKLVYTDPDQLEQLINELNSYSRGVDEAGDALKSAAEYIRYTTNILDKQQSDLVRKRDAEQEGESTVKSIRLTTIKRALKQLNELMEE